MTDVHSAGEFYSAFPERRINPFRPEVRSADGNGQPHIVGYASVFNKLSRKLGGFVEKVNSRAFNQSKTEGWPDVVCRYNHNDDFLLGTTRAGTCIIDFDETGLLYDVVPPSFRSDTVELCQRGDCQHSSFAFRVPEGGDDWGLSDYSYPMRTLLNVELVDVAPVITPAYPDATAATRAMDGAVQSLAVRFQAEPTEIRSLLESNMGVKLFKRSDRPMISPEKPEEVEEVRETVEDSQEEPVMQTADELRAAWYEAEIRAKFDTAARQKLAKSGEALPDGSYPITDEEDLHNAIHAIGRGNDSHSEIRDHIKSRAKALGLSHMLPSSWGSGGKQAEPEHNSAEVPAEERADTPPVDSAPSDTPADEDELDEEDENSDSEGGDGSGTESQGRSVEGTTDNGHKVDTAQANRLKLAALLEKRYDPYFFDSDGE
jgi:hypothetical protein